MENLYALLYTLVAIGGFAFGWWVTGLVIKKGEEQK